MPYHGQISFRASAFIDNLEAEIAEQKQHIATLEAKYNRTLEAIKTIHKYIHPHNSDRYSEFIDKVCDDVLYAKEVE